jgi:hypothetical protein
MPIFSDTHAHYHRPGAPDCNVATPAGSCLWPREPGLPECNAHLCRTFDRLHAMGATPAHVRALRFPPEVSADAMAEAFAKYLAHIAPKESGTEKA